MASVYDAFVGRYKMSKTLRFELKPVGRTAEHLAASSLLEHDRQRAEDYPAAKRLLDEGHKALIERSLKDAVLDWKPLAEALEAFRKDADDKEALMECQKNMRKKILGLLEEDEAFGNLTGATPKDYFKSIIQQGETEGKSIPQAVSAFSKFSCYFVGFQQNRANLYSKEEIAVAVPYRVVNDNFPKFLTNVHIYEHLQKKFPGILQAAEAELKPILSESALGDFFKVESYNRCLTQGGITLFNHLIGGYTQADGSKVRGLNEFVNLYRQQQGNTASAERPEQMTALFKQILSDRETLSFIPEQLKDDATLRRVIEDFREKLQAEKTFEGIREAFSLLRTSCHNVYFSANELSSVSLVVTGSWNGIRNAQEDAIEALIEKTQCTKREAERFRRELKADVFALEDVLTLPLFRRVTEGESEQVSLKTYWSSEAVEARLFAVTQTEGRALEALARTHGEGGLREDRQGVSDIKAYLDALMDLLGYLRPFRVSSEQEVNAEFYGLFDACYDTLDLVIPLYNRVRNYLTRKPGDTACIKLMFDCPTLAAGWDKNKERENATVLFERAGHYYLGITAPTSGKKKGRDIDYSTLAVSDGQTSDVYRKMVYKYLPGPNKMLPKVFFAKSNAALYAPPKAIHEAYKTGKHKKGKDFDLAFCHRLIDFFKESIAKTEDWATFGFRFSETSSYGDISEFYKEVAEQGYKITFENIPSEVIDRLVDEGRLYLFRLHNKDFSAGASGRPNLHTLYWRAVFSDENLRDVVVKLNGEAELFHRPASIRKPTVHRLGERLVNRRTKDGRPIPADVHRELFLNANGRLPEGLSKEAALWADQAVIKPVRHEIVKDRRFTEDRFFFHVPITFNFKAPDGAFRLNQEVIDVLRDNPKVNIIGLDRGERNLIYMTLIDQSGRLLLQKSFNIVSGKSHDGHLRETDYHALLDHREKERDAARKSWETIGKIKDLKAGYLSAVVHEIVRTAIDRNAIIVLEDLNVGFKRGRFCIEKQVYQKFEQMLIDKLNYLVFKDAPEGAPGSVLKGYQLTERFESFQKLGRQSGILFYVPAGYTSKIDPVTGFTNLFDLRKCTNAEARKAFFSAFDAIVYDARKDRFAFSFDYRHFRTGQTPAKTCWTVYSADRRLVYNPIKRCEETLSPTAILREALLRQGVRLEDGLDVKAILEATPAEAKTASFFGDVFYAFERTLQMRNSSKATGEDYIQSPVEGPDGTCFDSRTAGPGLPKDADANGAYHIALKGLWLLRHLPEPGEPLPRLAHSDWFNFRQLPQA